MKGKCFSADGLQLNKYSVVEEHFLLVTKGEQNCYVIIECVFESQQNSRARRHRYTPATSSRRIYSFVQRRRQESTCSPFTIVRTMVCSPSG